MPVLPSCRLPSIVVLLVLLAACGGGRDPGGGNTRPPPATGGNTCGNGALDGFEPCDGTTFRGSAECADYGLGEGKVSCSSCTLSFASCRFNDYCTANDLYANGECDNCELLGGVPDPECATACAGGDEVCGDRFDELTGQWTCRRRGLADPDCGMCGNNIIEGNELCDGRTLKPGFNRCEDWGFMDGTLSCGSACLPNFTMCRASRCGDGMKEGVEECEGTDLGGATCVSEGFAGGTLTCSSECKLNTAACVAPGCGNNIHEAGRGEACDGAELGGATCESLGFAGGTLRCNGTCNHDTSGCVAAGCGNGIIEPPLEQCEGANLNGATCQTQGFLQGTLACSPTSCTFDTSGCVAPGCGNGVIETPTEQCEGANLGGATCQSLGFVQGTLSCGTDCRFDTAMCVAAGCGNGIIEAPAEQCEGANLGGATCQSLGFLGGTLSCDGMCRYNTSACTMPSCGNGVAEGNEQCDGQDLRAATCQSRGLERGTLRCRNDCTYDLTLCVGCGSGRATGLQACDGNDFAYGATCAELDQGNGTPRCSSMCTYDLSTCTNRPDLCALANVYNDGFCDPCHLWGGTMDPDCATHCGSNGTCSSYFVHTFGAYSCELAGRNHDPDCGCGNGQLHPRSQYNDIHELCDGNNFDPAGATCAAWGFSGGNLTCAPNCRPNFNGCTL